ncbi:MAG: hypothetical protein NVS2B5_30770 [Beijerinckiaceae bacterium]
MIAGGTGLIVTSNRALDCTFLPSNGTEPEHYVGTVIRLGLDLGFTGPGELDWGVLAPTARFEPGALSGTYGGVGASASVGVGAGAALLIGGSGQTTSLQPLSVQGQTGANVAGGVEQIRLDYVAPTSRRYYRYHRRHHRVHHRYR